MILRLNIIDRLLKGKRACGINIWIEPDENPIIYTVTVTKKRSKLCISKKAILTSFDQIKDKITKDVPIYLSVDGKGIINRTVEQNKDIPLLDSILPNANSDDFYLQEIILSEEKRVISCARKEKIDDLLSTFSGYGYHVLGLILGPFSISCLSILFETETSILVPHYRLIYNHRSFEGYEENQAEYQIFNLELDSMNLESDLIISFSNCLCHFGYNNTINTDIPILKIQNESFRYQMMFRIFGWTIIIVLFFSLLINFFLFDTFSNRNSQLVSEIENNKEVLDRIEKLEVKVRTNETIYKSSLSFNNSYYAYYIDRIAKGVPVSITLDRLCVFPKNNTFSNDKTFSFQKDIIIITGNTRNSNQLESWIKSIERFDWIEGVSISNYSDNTTGPAKFDLEISLTENK